MIKSVENYPISVLFNIDAAIIYLIPRYQREYTWRTPQWESLFDDILENNPGYFLGSFICINQTNDSFNTQELEVVDGQQRLTTLSILFSAIYHAINNLQDLLDDDQKLELINLKRKLILKKGQDQLRVIPQVHNHNQDDYKSLLSDLKIISHVGVKPHAGNRRIYKAFRYFQNKIQLLFSDEKDKIIILMELLEKVSQATMVKIEVASHADAYTLFESLNNRGTPLTAIDLIKNKLLAQLESIEPGNIDSYFNIWNLLLTYLGDDYSAQERFFRQYYNAFKTELNEPFRNQNEKRKDPLAPIATRSNIIRIYEQLIQKNPKVFLETILEVGKSYGHILLRIDDDDLNGLEKPLRNLERIQGAAAYMLLVYLIHYQSRFELNERHLVEIINFLNKFFVRRNLTDTPPTRDLTRIFMGVIDQVSQFKGDEIVSQIRKALIKLSSTEKIFEEKLNGNIYEDNSGVTRFILCSLAEQGMTFESFIDLWKVENKRYIWTIEHIFPQGENIPQSWIDMMGNGDTIAAKAVLQSHVHKLGNLTISAYNSTLGNKSFEEKKNRKDKEGRYVGFLNKLNLNEELVDKENWTKDDIDKRTEKLVSKVIRSFNLTD